MIKLTPTEEQLIDAAMEIGNIAGSNCHYTAGLARRIKETGKHVTDLTIGELLSMHAEYRRFFNEVHGGNKC